MKTFPYLAFAFVSFCHFPTDVCAQGNRGLVLKTEAASPGFTLIAPFGGQSTFLIDLDGNVVHEWTTDRNPSQAAYLLPDGCLIRTYKVQNEVFNVVGGPAGGLQKFSWDGELLWDYQVSSDLLMSHHDIEPMPNGNVLVVAWELKTKEQCLAAGRDPEKLTDGCLWPETILELKPKGTTGADIVWRWNLWDHLVQSFDESKANFGRPDERPEKVDLNFIDRPIADWIHCNAVDYNPQLDQIMLCGRTFDELWVIDHSTSTEEAATGKGGKSGHGGDLLYRWGNPFAYFAGTPFDQKLFGQHDPHWIPEGLPEAGSVLIFNNGSDRDERPFSTVDELKPPVTSDGRYVMKHGEPFGPERLSWRYEAGSELYSQRVSGAQRLPNGNTLICEGETGRVFEVTRDLQIVWDYENVLGAPKDAPPPTAGRSLGGVAMFRAYRYPLKHSAFQGRNLTPAQK